MPGHLPPSLLDGQMSASLVGALRSTGDSGLNALGYADDRLTTRTIPHLMQQQSYAVLQ